MFECLITQIVAKTVVDLFEMIKVDQSEIVAIIFTQRALSQCLQALCNGVPILKYPSGNQF